MILIVNNQFFSNKSNLPQVDTPFGAGLTAKLRQEINNTDVIQISNKLTKKNIPTDFKGNKFLAWCCDKFIETIEQSNKKFSTNLALPKEIYAEDFRNLNDNPDAFGTCNFTKSNLIKNSDKEVQPKVIFFNTRINWDNIDEICDFNFKANYISTDFFLYPIAHEFSHVFHLDWLMKNFNGKTIVNKIELAKDETQMTNFQKKYKDRLSIICEAATNNQLEAVACDMPVKIINSLDKEKLELTKNPFIYTPYEKLSFWQRVNIPNSSDEKRSVNEILRHCWNGKF